MKKLISMFAAGVIAATACSCTKTNVLQTSAVPVGWLAKQSVIIDAGHGGADGGGVSVNGIPEKGINLSIAETTADLLRLMGYNVTMTRTEDISIHDKDAEGLKEQKLSDMKNRLELFNTPDSVCVSVHQNRFTDPKYSGAQMFYHRPNTEGQKLAEALKARITGYLQPENERETKPTDDELYLLCNCENPAVMAECGFISNPEEAALLEQKPYQHEMAFALFAGINDFCISSGRISEKNTKNK